MSWHLGFFLFESIGKLKIFFFIISPFKMPFLHIKYTINEIKPDGKSVY